MKQERTDITILLDASGSMQSIREDAIGGFNAFIEEQKKEEGEANLTAIFFDSNRFEKWLDGIDLKDCPALGDEYRPGAMTPLLDATGRTIEETAARLSAMDEKDRPGQTLCIILTDGHENASGIFTKRQIKEMIRHKEATLGWEFIFLAANVDAFAEGGDLGIKAQNIAAYAASKQGIRQAFDALSESAKYARKREAIANLGRRIKEGK